MPSEEGGDAGGVAATAEAALPTGIASPRGNNSRSTTDSTIDPNSSNAQRTRRSGSVVVYPEAEDVGKPKVFARQSFIVSGEEEEMADTILKARQLAGQRRRSTVDIDESAKGAILAAAQNLAARRDSLIQPPSVAAVGAAPAKGGEDAAAAVEAAVDPVEQAAATRRRSSVLNRIPDNLRALVQQSDASGVQQKTASPYPQGQQQQKDTTTAAATASASGGGNSERRGRHGWLHNAIAFIRWKGYKKKKNGRKGSGGRTENDSYSTPRATPTPGSANKGRGLLPPQLPKFAGRKQLILDLDETLVHSSFKPVPGADFIMDIQVDNTFYKVFVLKRPGVDEFLERVSKLYEVIIFTASLPQYANPLLDLLDPNGYCTSRLFREECTFHEGYFVKDLTLLRYHSLESTIIVDNSPMAYMFQPENAIDCISWIDEQDDTELWVIADFLEAIVGVPDVRDLLEFWREGGNVLDNVY